MAAFFAGMQFQKYMVKVEFTKTSPIALVGEFDLDGDGIDDIDKLWRMILRNGGAVSAYDRGDGQSFGQIDSKTFVVVGIVQNPDTGEIQILNDAERLGTNQKTIRELLKHLGVGPGAAIIETLDQRIGYN
jgi:hypothetical protein